LRERGALDASAQAFAEVARVAVDPALRLRAEAAAAEHLLLSDLKAERTALERIAAQLGTLPAGDESRSLQVRVHAALADNAVYAGDLARAAQHIAALAPVLGAVPRHERLHALETTIEVAMRRGEFDAAHAALARARAEHPGNVTFDICEAMLAWSEVRLADAVRGFQRVVREHPEQCRYIMVENDLGVALLAQGDLPGAELWVRRSLASWADVPHAQCLSRLNLGSVLTSAGRWSEAHDALAAALALAREQHSGLFEGEALHRLGRLSLLCGRADPALASLEAALACVPGDGDPLRLAQWHAQTVGAALAAGRPKAAEQHLAQAHACLDGRTHALAQARVARAEAWLALSRSATAPAQTAAQRMQTLARTHGLDELTAEADLLRARAHELGGEGPAAAALADQARTLAERRGCADLIWRAHGLLARVGGAAEHAVRASSLADALFTAAQALSPDRVAAARMEPRAD
jgi:tetratricopeptide (TPR) repeat protein